MAAEVTEELMIRRFPEQRLEGALSELDVELSEFDEELRMRLNGRPKLWMRPNRRPKLRTSLYPKCKGMTESQIMLLNLHDDLSELEVELTKQRMCLYPRWDSLLLSKKLEASRDEVNPEQGQHERDLLSLSKKLEASRDEVNPEQGQHERDLLSLLKKLEASRDEVNPERGQLERDPLLLSKKLEASRDEVNPEKGQLESATEMDRLRVRMELLCMQAVSYEFSVQSHWERYLVSHILNRFKRHLKQRYITIRDDHHKLSEIENKLTQIRIRDNHQPNKGTLWELTSFPSVKWPEIYGANSSEWWDAYYELCPIVQSNVPEYPDDIKEPFAELDVLSYLSRSDGELIRRKGDRVALNQETFKGKWVWVCCFHVPFLYRGCVDFYPLINLCRELYSTKASDFEMVVVARMNGLANTRDVFDYFFSGFPESCLAVPFEDDRKRDNICKVLGLGNVYNSCKSLFLNEERQVLERFWSYGADVFPFTKDMLDTKRRKFNDIINKKFVDGLRLKDVLIGCNKVCKFESRGDILDISNLGDKHVGLYLCSNGRLAPYLWNMWLKCREESKEFEVVVVYMPNFTSIAEPEKVDGWLQECSISGWWILPFNYSVSCWLEELTHRYSCYESFTGEIDKLVMVGPEVDCLEMHAGDVMLHQGIEAFPFTVAAGVKAAKRKVEGVTLKSLFVDGVTFFRGEDSKDTKTLHELVNGGKKIVVCIDLLYKCHTNNYPNESWDWELEFGKLASAYLRLGGESEMVFVEVGSEDKVADDVRQRYISKMSWYVCPRDGVNSSNAEELSRFLFTDVSEGCTTQGAVIGFGKDGQLCSYSRKEYLPLDDKDGSIFFTPLDVEILLGYNKF